MSSDLSVKLTRPVEIIELIQAAEGATKELLDICDVPPFLAFVADNGRWHSILSGLLDKGQVYAIKLNGFNESVRLTVIEIPQLPVIPSEEAGLWVGISVAAARTPLEFALAAAFAVALARLVGSPVIDDALRWNHVFEQAAEEFMAAVAVKGPFNTIQDAAEQMLNRIRNNRLRTK